MHDWLFSLTDGYMPHGVCLRWNAPLLFVFIAGNIGIAIAYFLIPLALQRFIGGRKDLPYPHMFRLFAAFILSCGITHLAKVWTLYRADYWLEAALDLWTAGVSLVTAALLYPLIPKALQLRSPRDLAEANAKLEKQVEETVKAKAEAEQARDEAIKATNLKSEFVATVSHEIRTPLSGVIGLAEILVLDPDPKELPELSQRMYEASKNLLSVLNALLDFSKLEAGKMSIEIQSFSLPELMTSLSELVKPNILARKLSLELDVDPQLPLTACGDEVKLRQILGNFLSNAIKFTEAGGHIKLQAQLVQENEYDVIVRFTVCDTGIGISPESLSNLFQPFIQGDASTTRKYGGTGLGLAIAKQLVELMDGEIGVESCPGEGSTFHITLPLGKEMPKISAA